MILPNGTIVAVADGEKLRLFQNKGLEPRISLVTLSDPDIDADNGGSGGRHRSSSANPDERRLNEDNFAAATAGYLNRQVLDGKFERLLIIADPRTLGELRKHFQPALEGILVGQLARDFTGHSVEAIETALLHA